MVRERLSDHGRKRCYTLKIAYETFLCRRYTYLNNCVAPHLYNFLIDKPTDYTYRYSV